ncbi:MAG: HAD-IA family hydrolase [Clostridia bacterium]|nr:HAD-IA family hydrolase [Clostridia bacterium]
MKTNKQYEWHFYDFFDTIVHRKCNPDATKMLWAKNIREHFNIPLSAEVMWKLRLESEETVRSQHNFNNEPPYALIVNEIYNRLISFLPNISQVDFYNNCLEIDINVEKSVQYLDDEILTELKDIKANGEKIAIISDFYLPSEAFVEFIKNLGISDLIDEIFVSSSLDLRKSNGTLYDYVLKKLNCVNSCIMSGDNYNSDYKIPSAKGVPAVHKPNKVVYQNLPDKNGIIKQIYSLEKELKKSKIPFINYTFYLYLFTYNLFNELKSAGAKNVFFLAREGKILKRVFEEYQKLNDDFTIKAHYLYASRASTMLPSLQNIKQEDFSCFFAEYNNCSVLDFLVSLGFTTEEIDDVCKNININKDEKIHNFSKSKEFNALKNSKFIDLYESKRAEQKSNFVEYINSFGANLQKEGLYIVDVGWKGSIQSNIFKILDKKVTVKGYYIGLSGNRCVDSKNLKKGLVFSKYPVKSSYYECFSQHTYFTEILLSADHGPTCYYSLTENIAKPVLAEDKNNDLIYNLIKDTQDGFVNSLVKINNIFKFSCYSPNSVLKIFADIQLKNSFVLNQKERKLKNIFFSNLSKNFGNISRKENGNNFFDLFKKFLKEFKQLNGSNIFKVMYFLKNIFTKLHLSFLNSLVEKIIYVIMKNKLNNI